MATKDVVRVTDGGEVFVDRSVEDVHLFALVRRLVEVVGIERAASAFLMISEERVDATPEELAEMVASARRRSLTPVPDEHVPPTSRVRG